MERYIMMSTMGVAEEVNKIPITRASVGAIFGLICSDFTYDKDSDLVYDHLLMAIRVANSAANLDIGNTMRMVAENRVKAHAKHGANSIEAKDGGDTLFWLSCLGEEYGEACEVMDDLPRYREEIIDFITVATAWGPALARV